MKEKFTPRQIATIKKMHAEKREWSEIAERFGVSPGNMRAYCCDVLKLKSHIRTRITLRNHDRTATYNLYTSYKAKKAGKAVDLNAGLISLKDCPDV